MYLSSADDDRGVMRFATGEEKAKLGMVFPCLEARHNPGEMIEGYM